MAENIRILLTYSSSTDDGDYFNSLKGDGEPMSCQAGNTLE